MNNNIKEDSNGSPSIALPSKRNSQFEIQSTEPESRHSSLSQQQKKSQNQLPQLTTSQSIFSIINSTVGIGILSLPYMVKNFGILIGILFLLLTSVLSIYTANLLLVCKNLCQRADYSAIGVFCFNKIGLHLINLIVAFVTLGGCISYVIVFGNTVDKLLEVICRDGGKFYQKQIFYHIISGIIQFPFIFAKEIGKLKYASYFSIVAISFFCFVTIYDCFRKIVFLAYCFHFNIFPIYRNLKTKTDKNMQNIILISQVISAVIYIIVAFFGYLSYDNRVDGNFLLSFTEDDLGVGLYYTIYIAYSILTTFAFPLLFFEGRNSTLNIVKEIFNETCYKQKVIENNLDEKINYDQYTEQQGKEKKKVEQEISFQFEHYLKLYYIGSIVIFAIIYSIGILYTDLIEVFGILGAVGGNAVVFLFPACFYLKLQSCSIKANPRMKKYSIIIIVFGCATGIISLVGTIINL